MPQQLARDDVEAALREMGEILLRAKRTGEIAIYGGAAILLQFTASFRTGDVDAVVTEGDHGAVLQAARDIADRRGWLHSWFSEAVSSYVGAAGGTSFHASFPSEARPALRVYVAKPDYLLAMKLRAMRVASRDEADAIILAEASGMVSYADMVDLLARYFPNEPPDERRLAIVKAFAESIRNAAPDNKPG